MYYFWNLNGDVSTLLYSLSLSLSLSLFHMFESLSDLQAIQSAWRNKILQPFACYTPGASDADEPCSTVLERDSSALTDQWRGAGESGAAVDGGYSRAGFFNANSLKAQIQEIRQFLRDDPSYHLFRIAKSKLEPAVEDYLVQIDGYTLVR